MFGSHACHMPDHPLVESREGLIQTRDHHPHLRPKQKHRLHHRHLKSMCHPPIRPLSPQNLYHLYPLSPRLPYILLHRRPIVVGGWKIDPSTWIKVLRSAAFHMLIKPSPSVPLYLQQPTSVASSRTGTNTYMMLGAPDLVPPVRQTYHTGVTGGGVDSPPPGLLFYPKSVSGQSSSGGLSVRMLTPGIPP